MSVFEHNPDPVYALDRTGRITTVNARTEQVTGYAGAELIGLASTDLIVPEDVARVRRHFVRALAGKPQAYEFAVRHRTGRRVEMQVTNIPIVVDGYVVGVYGIANDITVRRRLLELTRPMSTLLSVESQVKLMLEAMRGVLDYDAGGLYWADAERGVLRPAATEVAAWVSMDLDRFEIPFGKGIMGAVAQSNRGELVNHAERDPRTIYPEGAQVVCEHLIAVPAQVEGRIVGVFYVARRADPPFSDFEFEVVQLFISHAAAAIEKTHLFEQTRASEERFQHQATHDPLTELPNRMLLRDRLTQAIAVGTRKRQSVSLIVLDLDRFKEVNDSLGHHAGDRLLKEVSARLQRTLRSADTVARLGGDEFAVVLPDTDASSAVSAATKLQRALEPPLMLDGCTLSLAGSMGVAAYPEHGADPDTLLRHADVAMYTAKRARGGLATYAPEHDSNTSERLTLISALRRAIGVDDLTLHYQPQVHCASGRLVGVEALVRWWHPQRGLIPPDHFVPLAEQSGLIRRLTRWVIRGALGHSATWRQFGNEFSLSVNLSSHDLLDEHLPEYLSEQFTEFCFAPERLTVEITESALLGDSMRALRVLDDIRAVGVHVALDDFGTGYSSLSYLKEWPVDEIKVDRSFVRNMSAESRDQAIVRATIDLAHSLGLRVVAEGVEDLATFELLSKLGSDRAQGYYIGRPVAASQMGRWTAPAAIIAAPLAFPRAA
ncbi:MAG: hypothetical protein NVSMB2_27700 [Chloroflexota bacterium]